MDLNLIDIVILIGAIQGVLLSVSFGFIKKGNRYANYIFGVLLFLVSFSICLNSLEKLLLIEISSGFYKAIESFQLLFGPLLLFYISRVTNISFRISKKSLSHFIPFTIYLFLMLFDLYLINDTKYQIIGTDFNSITIFLEFFTNIQMLLYILLSIRCLKKYREGIENKFSNIDEINLSWIKTLLIGVSLVYLSFLAIFVVLSILKLTDLYFELISVIVSISIYCIAYYIILNARLFDNVNNVQKNTIEVKTKYENSPLTNGDIKLYWKELNLLMTREKLYRTHGLKISELAKLLDIPSQYVSQVISVNTDSSFYDFINRFRVEEIKLKIESGEHLTSTLLAISHDAGFNSKTTFNTVFKRLTGSTPTQFINKLGSI